MRLIVAHRILISSCIAAAVVLAVTRFLHYRHDGNPGTLAIAVAGALLIPLLGLYLYRIRNK